MSCALASAIIARRPRDIPVLLENKVRCLKVHSALLHGSSSRTSCCVRGTPRTLFLFCSDCLPSSKSARPSPLEIIAAKPAGDIHDLADEVQAGHLFGFHGLLVKLIGRNAAKRHFRRAVAFRPEGLIASGEQPPQWPAAFCRTGLPAARKQLACSVTNCATPLGSTCDRIVCGSCLPLVCRASRRIGKTSGPVTRSILISSPSRQ